MYKHYLTYQLALSFDRACCALKLSPARHGELMRCSRQMIVHFNQSLQAADPVDKSKSLYVAITYLRDCQGMLDEDGVDAFEIRGRWEVLHLRLEQMIGEVAKAEGGQLRMLG